MEYQVEPDFAARQAIIWSIAWLVGAVAISAGAYALLVFPDIDFIDEAKLRAVADTALVFGWLGCAAFAALYAIVPRIAEAQLHNEVLGAAATVSWSLVLAAGIGAILFGSFTDELFGADLTHRLAELPGVIDVAMLLLLVFVLFNAAVTLVRRRETTVYASGWYLLAGALSVPIVFVVGNLPVFEGTTDLIVSGFYRNGIEVLWLLPVALGVGHYVMAVDTGNSLYSASMARAGFWSLLFAGGWTGQRFFLGVGPDYLESVAVAMTLVLVLPVLTAVTNLALTARGRWGLLPDALGLRWATIGLSFLVAWGGAVALGVLPVVSSYTDATWYADMTSHLFFGVASSFAFALIYHGYPLMVGRAWASRTLASFHMWGTVAAVVASTGILVVRVGFHLGVLVAGPTSVTADMAS